MRLVTFSPSAPAAARVGVLDGSDVVDLTSAYQLCGKQPPRGFGRFALQHAPPAPDQAQGSLQPRPASASLGSIGSYVQTGRRYWPVSHTGTQRKANLSRAACGSC